jgi:aconitate hydratase
VTATDLVLTVTQILRSEKVVGSFVEFFGEGTASLSVPDRATLANMAPEYGATMGFFPSTGRPSSTSAAPGRTTEELEALQAYFEAQEMFGVPVAGQIDYTRVVSLDLGTVAPSLSGPRRPQDRIELGHVKEQFTSLFSKPPAENGFNQPAEHLLTRHLVRAKDVREEAAEKPAPRNPSVAPGEERHVLEMNANKPTLAAAQALATSEQPVIDDTTIGNGDVLIAAITSCTNTSNPSVMIAAGCWRRRRSRPASRSSRTSRLRWRLAPAW